MVRHVFLASAGPVLPIITEALWALMNPPRDAAGGGAARPKVVPQRVHIVTTAEYDPEHGYAEFHRRRSLLEDKVAELYRQYRQEPPEFQFEAVEDPEGEEGRRFIADVRTERENILYANLVTRHVRKYCAKAETVLHMLLAGGRKTMSSYDHSAMMFFGRVEDEMSHVLVHPQLLERAGEQFWWPDQYEKLIKVKSLEDQFQDVSTSSRDVTVDLVPVPFVRLGVRLPTGIPPEAEDYRDLIDFIEFEREGGAFVVDADTQTISFGSRSVKLTKTYFGFFAVFAIARKMGWPGFGSAEEGIGPNTAGFFPLNDLRAGLKGDAKNPVRNDTLALRCYRALVNDDRFQHGTESSLLKHIDQSRLNSRGRVVKEGKTVDYTNTYRSNLAGQLEDGVRSPYTLKWLIPETREIEDGRIIIGLNVPPDRIVLKGFDPFQLVEGRP